ncbi:MAG: hypothetical protein ABS75_27830 [Pelagibacterium sp. SCN 63-23]|jgi:TRAP-type C4-dicarboxylate transport system permease small subunit|nr:MAG: hypothetical protein ABS75_27830 [Pelagibacterium sp. SCN 63-23]
MSSSQTIPAAPKGPLALLDTIEGFLAALEKRAAALSLLVILVGVGLTIATRAIRLPIPSTAELAIVAMAPLTFIGAAFASYMHQHITIDIIDALGNAAVRRIAAILASLSMAAFAGTYCWLALSLFQYVWSSGERLIDLNTPVWIPVGCIVAGSFLMLVHSALDILRLVLGLPRTGTAR